MRLHNDAWLKCVYVLGNINLFLTKKPEDIVFAVKLNIGY